MLLYCAGIEEQELFETLQDPGVAEGKHDRAYEYQIALRTLDAHFSTQLNEAYKKHIFGSLRQEVGETEDPILLLHYESKEELKLQLGKC